MVMLAMLFMAEVRYDNESYYPLLSGADVVAVLKDILPHRAVTEEELFNWKSGTKDTRLLLRA